MRQILSSTSGLRPFYPRIYLLTHPLKPPLRQYIHLPWQFTPKFHSTLSSAECAPCFEYQFIDGVERLERYQPCGYHPTHICDVLADRYRVVHKLGYGTYSTVWLAHDSQRATYVAVKICAADAPPSEAGVLHALAKSEPDNPGRVMIPLICDQFELSGSQWMPSMLRDSSSS